MLPLHRRSVLAGFAFPAACRTSPGLFPEPAAALRRRPSPPGGPNDLLTRLIAPGIAERLGRHRRGRETAPAANGEISAASVAKAPADGQRLHARLQRLDHRRRPALGQGPAPTTNPQRLSRQWRPVGHQIPCCWWWRPGPACEKTWPSCWALGASEARQAERARRAGRRRRHASRARASSSRWASSTSCTCRTRAAVPGDGRPDGQHGRSLFRRALATAACPHVQGGQAARRLGQTGEKRLGPPRPTSRPSPNRDLPGYEARDLLRPSSCRPGAFAGRWSTGLARRGRRHHPLGPEVAKKFADLGADPQFGTPKEFAAYVADDLAKWTRVAKDAGPQGRLVTSPTRTPSARAAGSRRSARSEAILTPSRRRLGDPFRIGLEGPPHFLSRSASESQASR